MEFNKNQYYQSISLKELIGLLFVSVINGIANLQFSIIIPSLISILISLYDNKVVNNTILSYISKIFHFNISMTNIFICMLICWVSTRILRFISKQIYIRLNASIFNKINQITSSFINQIPLYTYLKHQSGYIKGQIFNLDKNMGVVFHIVFEHLIAEIITCVLSITTLMYKNFWFGILVLIWAIIHVTIIMIVAKFIMHPFVKKQVKTNSKRSGFYIEMCNMFFVTKFFNIGQILNDKVDKEYNKPYVQAGQIFYNLNAVLMLCVGMFAWSLVGVGGLGYLFSLVINKQAPLSTLIGLWSQIIWLMAYVFGTADHISVLIASLQTIGEGIDFMNENVAEKPQLTDIIINESIKSIDCSNITVKYKIDDKSTYVEGHDSCGDGCKHDSVSEIDDDEKKEIEITVCENSNVKINEGECVVILGPSGCGKTTLFNVINGLLTVNSGDVFINNINMKNINKDKLLNNIIYITQTSTLLDDTIEYNIKLGNMDISDEKLNGIINLLRLPDKKTNIGANGCRLSGGQKQRLCIARALAKYKAGDLILCDEITSNIDAKTANKVISYLVQLARNNKSILLFIDHTQMTIQYASKVVFFEPNDDNISQITCSTHIELLETNNNYKEYFIIN